MKRQAYPLRHPRQWYLDTEMYVGPRPPSTRQMYLHAVLMATPAVCLAIAWIFLWSKP